MLLLLTQIVLLSLLICQEPYDGYTLFTPTHNTSSNYLTYLIDNEGNNVNEWQHECKPASIAYLQPDSTLIYPCQGLRPIGGRIIKYNWNGTILWDYIHPLEGHTFHHDIEPLPNGNILVLAWEEIPFEEAVLMGREDIDGDMWPQIILELSPIGTNDAEIVWEWHSWDHIIQDLDSSLISYGILSEHPELFDINMGNLGGAHQNDEVYNGEWFHSNAIDYNEELDQIVFSSRFLNEIYIIDHSTTTEEAAGHSGGNSDKGGDVLYRWGNPENYGMGNTSDRMLHAPHSVNWILTSSPGEGNIILFNNFENNVGEDSFSSVIEINTPIQENGSYTFNSSAYEPEHPYWYFDGNQSFFCSTQSGAFRLPNGNTLITISTDSYFFEISYNGTTVWEHIHEENFANAIPRVQKYGLDYLTSNLLGDLNNDQVINILDIVLLVNIILNSSFEIYGDINNDNVNDILDLVLLVQIILQNN